MQALAALALCLCAALTAAQTDQGTCRETVVAQSRRFESDAPLMPLTYARVHILLPVEGSSLVNLPRSVEDPTKGSVHTAGMWLPGEQLGTCLTEQLVLVAYVPPYSRLNLDCCAS